jgi:hypothetical protein
MNVKQMVGSKGLALDGKSRFLCQLFFDFISFLQAAFDARARNNEPDWFVSAYPYFTT